MPKSRGRRKASQHRNHTRTRTQPRIIQPTAVTVPDWVTDDELETVNLIAMMMGGMPRTPQCHGPVVIHADGVMECHGSCESVFSSFHDEDTIEPCTHRPQAHTRHGCARCTNLHGYGMPQ